MIFNKAGITEQKYMSHSAEDCTGTRTNRTIKGGLRGYMGSRYETVKQYKKSEKNGRKS